MSTPSGAQLGRSTTTMTPSRQHRQTERTQIISSLGCGLDGGLLPMPGCPPKWRSWIFGCGWTWGSSGLIESCRYARHPRRQVRRSCTAPDTASAWSARGAVHHGGQPARAGCRCNEQPGAASTRPTGPAWSTWRRPGRPGSGDRARAGCRWAVRFTDLAERVGLSVLAVQQRVRRRVVPSRPRGRSCCPRCWRIAHPLSDPPWRVSLVAQLAAAVAQVGPSWAVGGYRAWV
jgi:hypothetical protein